MDKKNPQNNIKAFKVWGNVYQIGGPEISGPEDCSVYMISSRQDLLLVDSGAGQSFDRLVQNIESLGFDPKKIKIVVATHAHLDHIGSLARFKEKFGVKVTAHKLDAEEIETGKEVGAELYGLRYRPCKVDIKLTEEKERLIFGEYELNILHTPGHTPGSIACYLDVGDKRILFGQDIHGPYNLPGADLRAAKNSLQKLIDLQADILCEGHFGIYQPKEEVEKYIESYLEEL